MAKRMKAERTGSVYEMEESLFILTGIALHGICQGIGKHDLSIREIAESAVSIGQQTLKALNKEFENATKEES